MGREVVLDVVVECPQYDNRWGKMIVLAQCPPDWNRVPPRRGTSRDFGD
jgi:hypothetical protein